MAAPEYSLYCTLRSRLEDPARLLHLASTKRSESRPLGGKPWNTIFCTVRDAPATRCSTGFTEVDSGHARIACTNVRGRSTRRTWHGRAPRRRHHSPRALCRQLPPRLLPEGGAAERGHLRDVVPRALSGVTARITRS